MGVEQVGRSRRAQVHAARGDPVRLAIVDALALGDRSPGELGESLALPSNLLAHHLRSLEQVGLVQRGRSEADKRRTYVRLVPAALPGAPRPGLTTARVVFVCTHNSARSQRSSVPDPVRVDTAAAFERAYGEIGQRVDRLVGAVEGNRRSP